MIRAEQSDCCWWRESWQCRSVSVSKARTSEFWTQRNLERLVTLSFDTRRRWDPGLIAVSGLQTLEGLVFLKTHLTGQLGSLAWWPWIQSRLRQWETSLIDVLDLVLAVSSAFESKCLVLQLMVSINFCRYSACFPRSLSPISLSHTLCLSQSRFLVFVAWSLCFCTWNTTHCHLQMPDSHWPVWTQLRTALTWRFS